MAGYSSNELATARSPIRDHADRGTAVCALGHLEVEQRENRTDDRAAIIAEIRGNILSFDTGAAGHHESSPARPAPAAPAPKRLPASTVAAGITSINGGAPQRQGGFAIGSVEHTRANALRQYALMNPASDVASDLRRKDAAGDGSIGMTSMRREMVRAGLVPAAG